MTKIKRAWKRQGKRASEGDDDAGAVDIARKRRRTSERGQRTQHVLPVECLICRKDKWIRQPNGSRIKEPLTNCEYEKGTPWFNVTPLIDRVCHSYLHVL